MTPIAALALLLTVQQTTYDTVFEQVKNLQPASAAAPVHDLVLRRDVLQLTLDSGTAYLLTPVGDRTIGIAFVGAGSVSFAPPLIVERYNLQHVLGDSSASGPITAAVFIFADSTADELRRQLKFADTKTATGGDAADAVHEALDYLIDSRSHSGDQGLFSALLNHTTTEYFTAYLKRRRGESVMMQFDPTQAEEVLLLRRGKMAHQRTEIVCQFQRAEDFTQNISVTNKDVDVVAVDGYDIDATIDGNYKFAARTGMRLMVGQNRQQWIPFYLYGELEIDSVTTSAGAPLTYYHRDGYPELWIRLAKPASAGDTVNVRIAYHGNLIGFGSAMEDFLPPWWDPSRRQQLPFLDAWAFIKAPSEWYPRYSPIQRAKFALTFHTPTKFKFASVGRLVDSSTTGDVRTTRWESELPARNVSFNIGTFEQLDIRDPRIPPVTVEVNSEAHRTIGRVFLSARNPQEFVGADIANSLAFFTRMFGPPLFHQYYATEIPYYHGEAFPGLIHLTWMTFLGLSDDGQDEIFRAHEMAHQWWGIGVEPAGYRDAWLSEGFSDFAGMWYMQAVLHDNAKYLKTLRDARVAIRRERGNAAPIGLGRRAGESYRGNYELSIYKKGAWVLHMLRNMMLDTRTMSEDRFIGLMQDFYETYRGKRATTEDFQRAVERHVGEHMDWFFNEWVYGTGVPTYTFSWSADSDSAGVAAHLRVRQSDVPEAFAMYVPVLIKFDQGEALVRLLVRGHTTDATLRLPALPKSMQLNPLESVLAEVKTEDWHQ
jgi:peptidase M1-like protein